MSHLVAVGRAESRRGISSGACRRLRVVQDLEATAATSDYRTLGKTGQRGFLSLIPLTGLQSGGIWDTCPTSDNYQSAPSTGGPWIPPSTPFWRTPFLHQSRRTKRHHTPMPPPGSSVSPGAAGDRVSIRSYTPGRAHGRRPKRTSVDILVDRDRHLAKVLDPGLHGRKQRAVAQVAAAVHGPLQRVVLPPEDVVAVLAVPRAFSLCVSKLEIFEKALSSVAPRVN
jgi:hypothetical protein